MITENNLEEQIEHTLSLIETNKQLFNCNDKVYHIFIGNGSYKKINGGDHYYVVPSVFFTVHQNEEYSPDIGVILDVHSSIPCTRPYENISYIETRQLIHYWRLMKLVEKVPHLSLTVPYRRMMRDIEKYCDKYEGIKNSLIELKEMEFLGKKSRNKLCRLEKEIETFSKKIKINPDNFVDLMNEYPIDNNGEFILPNNKIKFISPQG
ncbi:hypothetical protein J4456_00605 [Candidatus Pacearchaeota archaeon]|nr:hypothetical protein [Candidatus Pacearchaeota archaeon]